MARDSKARGLHFGGGRLQRVEKALKQIDELCLTPGLCQSNIGDYWTSFRQLTEQLLVIKVKFDGGYAPTKFYDNVDVQFLQFMDVCTSSMPWRVLLLHSFPVEGLKSGEHRSICKAPREEVRFYHSHNRLVFLFPFYLLQRVYPSQRENGPSCDTSSITIFNANYSSSRRALLYGVQLHRRGTQIDVLPTSDHQSKHAKEDAPRQIHEFARLARSAGTMQLHVAAIANAGFGRYICCPMRSEVRKSFDVLALLADRRLEGAITYEMYGELIKGLTEEVDDCESLIVETPSCVANLMLSTT
ncbi:hypothetical protein B0H10DRAFT_1958585 [Mycena sp. CBHHK59/15]|nr:hypothetical protein B0H10DRAFT_1958585 [Mycena sp. CBHHK59/15]